MQIIIILIIQNKYSKLVNYNNETKKIKWNNFNFLWTKLNICNAELTYYKIKKKIINKKILINITFNWKIFLIYIKNKNNL